LTSLRGVGETLAGLIRRAAGGDRVIDLLFHLPDSYIDRRERCALKALQPGRMATVAVEVVRIEPPWQRAPADQGGGD
jgi:ATP-dependent DNA helicase RecG